MVDGGFRFNEGEPLGLIEAKNLAALGLQTIDETLSEFRAETGDCTLEFELALAPLTLLGVIK
jgi:hypothetical protein